MESVVEITSGARHPIFWDHEQQKACHRRRHHAPVRYFGSAALCNRALRIAVREASVGPTLAGIRENRLVIEGRLDAYGASHLQLNHVVQPAASDPPPN
jgi:hypothetical protein